MKLPIIVIICSAFTAAAQTSGQLSSERWNNLPSSPSVYTLRQQGILQRLPDTVSSLSGSEVNANTGERYGIRLRGIVTPPVTGSYTFYVSGDDGSELLLASNSQSYDKNRIAWSAVYTAPQQWNKFPTQRSRTLRLIAGQSYYLESLLAENGGGDHLSLGWSYEGDGLLTTAAIGTPVTQTWTETAPGAWQASVDAGDIWGNADRFSFNSRDWSGDGEFTVKVSSMNQPHAWAKAGIMVRASLAADSAHAMMIRSSASGMSFQRRRTAAASSSATTQSVASDWVRLVRKGETITAYSSSDGETWSLVGSDTFPGLPLALKVGLVATDTSPTATAPLVATFSGADFKTLSARELIPASALTSYSLPADDADGDSLPDTWEAANALSTSASTGAVGINGEYGDPDGDGISNHREYLLGSDPKVAELLASSITRERWFNVGGDTISSLVTNRSTFLREPDTIDWPSTTQESDVGDNYGTRMRGYISAPVTGNYTFWITGDDEVELWFADGSVKHPTTAQPLTNRYGKQKLAWIRDERFGQNYTNLSDFDRFATQRSRSVSLVAGQLYYLEILHKEGGGSDHCALAWQVPGQSRMLVPATALVANFPEPTDSDDDYLPSDWETANQFNPANNGFTDVADGQYGDPDADGLNNLAEFQLGTNPRLADTDGDGWSDIDERDRYRSNPLVSNAIQPGPLTQIVLSSAIGGNAAWNHQPDGSAIGYERRGWTEYPLNIAPGDEGIYEITLVGGAAGGSVRSTEKLPLSFAVDGKLIARSTMTCVLGQNTTVKQLTPWLQAGNHSIRLENHNIRAGCTLRINSLSFQRLGGAALAGETLPLWVKDKLQKENLLTRYPTSSRTSPVCIEGVSPWTVNITSAGNALPVNIGPDAIFYSNIPLNSAASIALDVSMQNGAIVQQHAIEWTKTNLSTETNAITLRQGDSLLLTSHEGATAEGSFALTLATNPSSRPPVAGSFAAHLPTSATTAPVAWPDADPALIAAASGTMQGSWIPSATAATAYHITPDATGATMQLQFYDNTYTKVAKVRIERTANGLAAWQMYAKYKSGNHLAQNFDALSGTSSAPAGSGGYGVKALALSLRYALPTTTTLTPQGGQASADAMVTLLDVPGTYILTSTWTSAAGIASPAKTLTVHCKTASFGSPFQVQTYNRRTWTLTEMNGIDIQAASSLTWAESSAAGSTTRSFVVSAYDAGQHAVLARLPETGDIIAQGVVDAFAVGRVGETGDAQTVEVRPDGTRVFRFTIVAALPENIELKLSTYYQGAVFPNGSRNLTLTSDDFDPSGIANVFIEWIGTGPPKLCHTLSVVLVD